MMYRHPACGASSRQSTSPSEDARAGARYRSRLPEDAMPARLACALLLLAPAAAAPQQQEDRGKIMLTIFLRHDQSKTLTEIRAQLERTGFMEAFPPAGIEVVSWYVMMGIGQVVTLRFPAERLREVNRLVEEKAWGAYRTDFYPTYDYRAVAEQEHKKTAK